MRRLVEISIAFALGCSGPARAPARPVVAARPAPAPKPVVHHLDDPDLNHQPPPKLLAIDWKNVSLASDADALALWKQIEPTGEDWEEKLDEIPSELPIARPLAIALLHEGNFTCTGPKPPACSKVPLELESPGMTAGLADPCLRRLLALWSVAQLEDEDLPKVRDALRAIASLPPPESQLVAKAIDALPESDQDGRMELVALAWKAGQHELVEGKVGGFDEAHLITLATTHHVGFALDALSSNQHRAPFLHAIGDEQMPANARASAMVELTAQADKLQPDVHQALAVATKSADCTVAATAARTLDLHGDHTHVPKLPHTTNQAQMMRAICVLASYEQLIRSDEPSYLPGYIPNSGLELVTETYDPYANPPQATTTTIVKPGEVVLPELDDLVRAMRHCTGTTCSSDDRDFAFGLKNIGGQLLLAKLQVTARPPCPDK